MKSGMWRLFARSVFPHFQPNCRYFCASCCRDDAKKTLGKCEKTLTRIAHRTGLLLLYYSTRATAPQQFTGMYMLRDASERCCTFSGPTLRQRWNLKAERVRVRARLYKRARTRRQKHLLNNVDGSAGTCKLAQSPGGSARLCLLFFRPCPPLKSGFWGFDDARINLNSERASGFHESRSCMGLNLSGIVQRIPMAIKITQVARARGGEWSETTRPAGGVGKTGDEEQLFDGKSWHQQYRDASPDTRRPKVIKTGDKFLSRPSPSMWARRES